MQDGGSGRSFSSPNVVVVVAAVGEDPAISCDQTVLVVLACPHRARSTVAWNKLTRFEGEIR